MACPQLVRLKKVKGEVVQDCDIYIGPKQSNSNWNLEESKWHNPYHFNKDNNKALRCYKDHILASPYLIQCLPELAGKTLGCFCADPKCCHGTVLIQLYLKLVKKVDEHTGHGHYVLYFKGESSPLSNLFRCPLKNEEGHIFGCLEQMRIYDIANQNQDWTMAAAIVNARSIPKVCQLSKMIHHSTDLKQKETKEWRMASQVHQLLKLLQIKYEQCPTFALLISDLTDDKLVQKKLIMEATSNLYWGCGVDFSLIEEKKKRNIYGDCPEPLVPTVVQGQNVLGFTLMLFCHCVKIRVSYGGLNTKEGKALETRLKEGKEVYHCHCAQRDADWLKHLKPKEKNYLWSAEELCALRMLSHQMHALSCPDQGYTPINQCLSSLPLDLKPLVGKFETFFINMANYYVGEKEEEKEEEDEDLDFIHQHSYTSPVYSSPIWQIPPNSSMLWNMHHKYSGRGRMSPQTSCAAAAVAGAEEDKEEEKGFTTCDSDSANDMDKQQD